MRILISCLSCAAIFITYQSSLANVELMVPRSLQRIPVATNPVSVPANSQFQTLEQKFVLGKGVEIKDLKGWYTGRCFYKDSPSQAVATLLAADQDPHSKTNGPAFNSADYRHLTPLVDVRSKSDKFDHLDTQEITAINSKLKTSRTQNAYPVRSNEELVVAGHRTTELESRAYRIRKSGDYFLLKLECAENSYCTNINSWATNRFLAYEGEAVAYCYYFKRLR